jgi:hypothetical protein
VRYWASGSRIERSSSTSRRWGRSLDIARA